LEKKTRKKPRLMSQPWIKELVQSTMLNVMKIPHFGHPQEVNACVKPLLSCYHGRYVWIDRRTTMDPMLIHCITCLGVKGPDPQQFYPDKESDHSLAQCIKEDYKEVEKGKRGYKVASIKDGTVCLTFQLIARNIVAKNRPTQFTRFMVDLTGKCVEGM
jgi:hypothetical protein